MFHIDYNSRLWHLVEWWYSYAEPPPRKRDPSKPLQVIAVGFSRSATESLQGALIKLGYDPCYHGWDLIFSTSLHNQAWVNLCKKKFYSGTGDCHITAEEFDRIIGHSVAIVDMVAACFATELIEAYPDAKVICNHRRNIDAWHASSNKHIVGANENFMLWLLSWWDTDMFWMWTVTMRYMHLRLGRSTASTLDSGLRSQGKWVYREHMHTVSGLLASRGESHRLLDWYAEDGWEPLCKFLGKDVPNEPFPRTNDAAGFEGRIEDIVGEWGRRGMKRMGLTFAALAVVIALVMRFVR